MEDGLEIGDRDDSAEEEERSKYGSLTGSVSEEEVEQVRREVQCFTMASHLFWSLWAIVNVYQEIEFGYMVSGSTLFNVDTHTFLKMVCSVAFPSTGVRRLPTKAVPTGQTVLHRNDNAQRRERLSGRADTAGRSGEMSCWSKPCVAWYICRKGDVVGSPF